MKISVISLTSRIKMYFDISCPATWASLKIVRKDYKDVDIDYEPVSDYKIQIAKLRLAAKGKPKNLAWNGYYSTPKRSIEEIENDAALAEEKIKLRLKDIPSSLEPELEENWKQTYENIVRRGDLLPILFLTGVKMHYPHKLIPAIYKIGTRLWEDELPTHKGCYLSTCSREIGLEFRESEFIISNLSHLRTRKKLENRCTELVEMELFTENKEAIPEEKRQSPIFIIPSENNLSFMDVYQLKQLKAVEREIAVKDDDTWRLWLFEDIPSVLKPELKKNWKQIYEEIERKDGHWPTLFLTAVKMHFPNKFEPAIYKIGTRLWEDELSTNGEQNILDCGREIGLKLSESAYIFEEMEAMWGELGDKSKEFLDIHQSDENKPIIGQGKRSPLFIFPTETAPILVFHNWNQNPHYFKQRTIPPKNSSKKGKKNENRE